jgi:hypothetical protein
MPSGFTVDSAAQVFGASNDVKSATRVVPSNPLPVDVPFSGEESRGSSGGASESSGSSPSGASSSPQATRGAGDDGKLRIDLAGSSVTVFVMTKG